MKTFSSIAGLLFLLAGCNKSAQVTSKTYSGNFVLTTAADIPLTGRLHIQFSQVNFSGAGDSSILPYVGSGVFKVTGDSIIFTQTGAVPEIFGRGSILEGSYRLEKNNDSLIFSRKTTPAANGPKIIYQLQRD